MQRSLDESIDCHSDTESIVSSQFDELNYAMIHDDPHSPLVSPSRKKTFRKTLQLSDSSSNSSDWRTKYTRTICNESPPQKRSQEKIDELKQKYPTQRLNIKCATVTVKRKDNTKNKYENVCPICLDEFTNFNGLLNCGHKFCFQCIEQWSKTSTNCPCCRNEFRQYVKVTMDSVKKIEKKRQIVKVEFRRMEFNELDYFVCYECNRGDDEDVLLICDMCDFYCCHVYCDASLRNVFPSNDWYCQFCKQTIQSSLVQRPNTRAVSRTQSVMNTQRQNTQITRTVTAKNSPQRFIEDEFSSDSDQEDNFLSARKTKASNKNHIQVQRVTRSKAYEIMNLSNRPSRNNQNQRSVNNTAVNLRNLRRRRVY